MRVLYFSLILWIFNFTVNPLYGQETQSRRFQADQLGFFLEESDGEVVQCAHTLLKHVPWWRVVCGERAFTVDVWREQLYNESQKISQKISRITLMYHVSEGLASSGEKIVQFNTHFTRFDLTESPSLQSISSSMDIRNGQASLVVRAQL